MTTAALLGEATRQLSEAGIESPRREARLLLAHAMNVSSDALLFEPAVPDARQIASFHAHLARRLAREPMAYILGHKQFWSLDFAVGPGALVPRPETETLIEQALKFFPDRSAPLSILDLGTGTGCLLIAALSEFPNAHGLGIDASRQALRWAEQNVAKHGLEQRCELREGTWSSATGSFDLILSNPPYIPAGDIAGLEPDVHRHEPELALDGGADGLDAYRALAPLLIRLLAPKGLAFLELGQGQEPDVAAIIARDGLEIAVVGTDLLRIPRCLVIRHGPERL